MRNLTLGLVASLALLAGCPQRERVAGVRQEAYQLVYRFEPGQIRQLQFNVDGQGSATTRPAEAVDAGQPAPFNFSVRFRADQTIQPEAGAEGEAVSPDGNEPAPPVNEPGENEPVPPAGEEEPGIAAGPLFQIRQHIQQVQARMQTGGPAAAPPPAVQQPQPPRGAQWEMRMEEDQVNLSQDGQPRPLPPSLRQDIQAALDQPIIATVDDRGRILRVQWTAPRQLRTLDGDVAGRTFWLTQGTGAVNLWLGLIRLPDREVRIGEMWTYEDRVPIETATPSQDWVMLRNSRYTLRDVVQEQGRPVALIDLSEEIRVVPAEQRPAAEEARPGEEQNAPPAGEQPVPGGQPGNQQPIALQTRTGTARFDIQAGQLLQSEQQFQMQWNDARIRLPQNLQQMRQWRDMLTSGQATGTIRVNQLAGAEGAPPPPDEQPEGMENAPGASSHLPRRPGPVARTEVRVAALRPSRR